MTERQVLGDAVGVGFIHLLRGAEIAAALRVFGGEQMALARAHAHDFAGAGDLEPLGHCFSGFDAFGATHKYIFRLKKSAQYRGRRMGKQALFPDCSLVRHG